MLRTVGFLFTILLVTISTPSWSADGKAYVTYLEGTAFKSHDGKDWKPLSKGDALGAGDNVKTGAKSKLEIALPDGSKIRLSENTAFKVESLLFTEEERGFGIKVIFGKIWSKAARFKKVSKFEIKTANAVAGVKGTTYRLDVNQDTSSLVKVYEGEVYVGNAPAEGEGDKGRKPEYVSGPKEVSGPHEVTREEWTYIVKSWQQITISSKGVPSKPVSFAPEEDRDEWVAWNQGMDKNK